MEFIVLNRQEAANTTRPGVYGAIVSINDPGMRMPWEIKNFHDGPRLSLYFHDIRKPFPEDVSPFEASLYQLPQKEDVERLIHFARALPEEATVMTHCYAGISRSSAAAIIIMATKYDKDEIRAKMTQLLEDYPWIFPNQLLIHYADELLGYDGWLEETTSEILSRNMYDEGWEPLLERKYDGQEE